MFFSYLLSVIYPRASRFTAFLGVVFLLAAGGARAETHAVARPSLLPEFTPCSPVSDYSTEFRVDLLETLKSGVVPPDLNFCAEWNPEFSFNGHHCCTPLGRARRRGRPVHRCFPQRRKRSYCGEITHDQQGFRDLITQGPGDDVLKLITQQMGRNGDQAFCSVNNGFLAWGLPVVPTAQNRVQIRSAERCTNYGTDGMVGLVEWVGRQVSKQYADAEYAGVRLLVGDISAPRGGCLGHASHTSGQDADIGFLTVKPGRASPGSFHRDFDAKTNWWLIKQIFKNPYACVKVMFLDRRLVRKLGVVAGKSRDEEWEKLRRFIRHMPGHRNHMHVRIGEGPGQPGCVADARPELEFEDDGTDLEFDGLINDGPGTQEADRVE